MNAREVRIAFLRELGLVLPRYGGRIEQKPVRWLIYPTMWQKPAGTVTVFLLVAIGQRRFWGLTPHVVEGLKKACEAKPARGLAVALIGGSDHGYLLDGAAVARHLPSWPLDHHGHQF